MCKGVRPLMLVALTARGHCVSSHWIRSFLPDCTASWRGRFPLLFRIHKSAPLLSRIRTISRRPLAAAQCAGVLPLSS
ncbi:hypothetical protein X975_07443, partial [Stegodyphus mimosarum]